MNTIRIGLAGFGTVGSAVYHHLKHETNLLLQRSGAKMVVSAIAVRNPRRRRNFPKSLLVPNVEQLAASSADIIVEVMGGCNRARSLVLSSLRLGKPVVTANKALLAEHGPQIFGEASRTKTPIYFEASVAGGIPIIQALREGLVANRFQLIYGIVNGTCNYILSQMTEKGLTFESALQEAHDLGYAEADPSLDIDGIDSAHKAAILASLAHGGCIKFKNVHIEGIRHLSAIDVNFALQLGYKIKLLAIIRPINKSEVEVRVHPTLIPKNNRLASIRGPTNAINIRGHVVGDVEFSGPGAGGNATASAILSDLVQASGHILQKRHHDKVKGKNLTPLLPPICLRVKGPNVADINNVVSRYYLRLNVEDRPGVLAQITSILGKARIGISSVIQPEEHDNKTTALILMLDNARHDAIQKALKQIRQLACVKARPVVYHVETFDL